MRAPEQRGTTLDLLDKREIKFVGITLRAANLSLFAREVADELGMSESEILVTDVIGNVVTIDVLRGYVDAHRVLGRSDGLLARLRSLPGVTVDGDARVESRGVLGWIAADQADVAPVLEAAQRAAAEIESRIRGRARVFSTGAEVLAGAIEDTNRQTLARVLGETDVQVDFGGVLPDDVDVIIGSLRRSVNDGHGLVITTGGVGAEAKDHSVEAVLALDPGAATPYLCHFEPGHGRHVKDGVRIGVGVHMGAWVVALPGPNDEVEMVAPILRDAYAARADKEAAAAAIAMRLRSHLRERMQAHPHEERGTR